MLPGLASYAPLTTTSTTATTMPEALAHPFAITYSLSCDLTKEMIDAFASEMEKVGSDYQSPVLWYATCTEEDENGRLHMHAGVIYKNARKPCNVKACLKRHPVIKDSIVNCGSKYSIQVKRMTNDFWLTTYMQKDGPLTHSNLPDDLTICAPYFSEINVKRMNPEFERWARLYQDYQVDLKLDMPPTIISCYRFFNQMFHKYRLLRVVTDEKKMKERSKALFLWMNEGGDLTDSQIAKIMKVKDPSIPDDDAQRGKLFSVSRALETIVPSPAGLGQT